jgi:RNA polymerase sigma-70 factor (ECF subfamily)
MTSRTLQNVSPVTGAWNWIELRGHCLAITRRFLPRADAEDAAQEALLRAWVVAHRSDIRVPEAWLTRVARNEALRIVAREQGLAGRYATLEVDLAAADGWEDVLHDRIEVHAGLRRLDPADRELLQLRYFDDGTQADVARALGIPEGTAKVRLHRARRRLVGELGERGP